MPAKPPTSSIAKPYSPPPTTSANNTHLDAHQRDTRFLVSDSVWLNFPVNAVHARRLRTLNDALCRTDEVGGERGSHLTGFVHGPIKSRRRGTPTANLEGPVWVPYSAVVGRVVISIGLAVLLASCTSQSGGQAPSPIPATTSAAGWQLDHVVIVVADLDRAVAQAKAAGFSVVLGGKPAGGFDRNASSQMSVPARDARSHANGTVGPAAVLTSRTRTHSVV